MTQQELQTRLNTLGVTPPDLLRSSLYYQLLVNARLFFTNTMSGNGLNGLGNNYAYVQEAVQSPALLNQLAEILDFFVAPAVHAQMRTAFLAHAGWSYQDYFTNTILDANDVTYANNVGAFFTACPIADNAVTRILANFQANIFEACTRIIADRAALENFYGDLYQDLSLDYLKSIKSSGSDFHKGGKQVLILTFSKTSYTVSLSDGDIIPVYGDLKMIYKPSDLEADCMLIGNSAAVARVDNAFNLPASLAEILNARIAAAKQADQNSTLETLPTYRILPRNYTSTYNGMGNVPLRDAYGYIEYLDYHLSDGIRVFGYYPFGSSDYLIFNPGSSEAQDIVRTFYRILGQWLAISCTFSITDQHVENVRVRRYLPNPIDLEVSLIEEIADITNTVLFGMNRGGIDGVHINNWEYHWTVDNPNGAGTARIDQEYEDKYYQNRLWGYRPGRTLVPIHNFWINEGFTNGMNLLRSAEQGNYFAAWFGRLDNVLVRYLAYTTGELRSLRDSIYITTVMNLNQFGSALLNTIQTKLTLALTADYNAYVQPAPPNFLAMQAAVIQTDLVNLDIPVFYHRVGTTGIVDSQGRNVAIPATVAITGNPAAAVNLGGRMTFFAAAPTTANVQAQLNTVSGGGFNARVATLQGQLLNQLGIFAAPNAPGALF